LVNKQNAIPVSAAFVVTSTQPFALAPPGKTSTNYPSFKPCDLTSKPDGTLVNVVENGVTAEYPATSKVLP